MTLPYEKLPAGVRMPLKLYIEDGIHPGGFLEAVLCNNLINAVHHGSRENLEKLPDIVKWLYLCAPSICWRDEKKFSEWIRKLALKRRNKT